MVHKICHYLGESVDPYQNLAIEQYLMETVGEDSCILYLWQNRQTVVIGRNQNAWAECRTTELNRDGGHLARRLSGGGAVYHDMGNLNFTFLVSKKNYDLQKQLQVIVTACRNLGLNAQITGRNDVTIAGRKFSGNAFFDSKGQAYHHGTLLVDVDMAQLGQYLMPSKAKLQSKGVDSVRSRVGNLRELNSDITIEAMKAALTDSFSTIFNNSVEKIAVSPHPDLLERYRSWEWNYGQKLPFSFQWEDRLSFGCVRIEASVENGIIRRARVYTDAMDWQLPRRLEAALTGTRLDRAELTKKAPEFSGVFQRMDI